MDVLGTAMSCVTRLYTKGESASASAIAAREDETKKVLKWDTWAAPIEK